MKGAFSLKRHGFPPTVIRLAAYLYFRFTLNIRDVEEMSAQRGTEAGDETVRCRVSTFEPAMAAGLWRRKMSSTGRWRSDEGMTKIDGRRMIIWRALKAWEAAIAAT